MKILFLSELFYPHGGGAELATYLYAKLMSRSGNKIVVITNRFADEQGSSSDEGFTVYRLPLFRTTESVKYSVLLRIDALLSPFMRKMMKWADVVYVPRFWFSAILLAKQCRVPVVTHFHDYIPICPLANYFDVLKKVNCTKKSPVCPMNCIYAYEKTGERGTASLIGSAFLNSVFGPNLQRILALSDAIICVSKAQAKIIADARRDLSSKLNVVYNPLPEARLDVDGCDFGYFGGFNYIKGFHVLLSSLFHLTETTRRKLHVHATKFEGLDLHLRDRFGRLGVQTYGKLNSTDYSAVRRRVRTVIVPSVWEEPLPYVVTEALQTERIVIASRIGGIPEQADGCKGAFLFDPGDHDQLAEKLSFIVNAETDDLIELGINNREFVSKKFNNDRILVDFQKVIIEVTD